MLRVLILFTFIFSSITSAFAEELENDFGSWNKINILVPINERVKFNLDTQYRYQKDELNNNFQIYPSIGVDLGKGFSLWNGYTYNNFGDDLDIDENRIWQQIQHEKSFSKALLVNRIRLEERFFSDTGITGDNFSLRGRYLMRGLIPFTKNKKWSLVLSDEVLVNFNNALLGLIGGGYEGNRFFSGINYRINDYFTAELGYQLQHINPGDLKISGFRINAPQFLNHCIVFNTYFTAPQLFNKNKKMFTTQPVF